MSSMNQECVVTMRHWFSRSIRRESMSVAGIAAIGLLGALFALATFAATTRPPYLPLHVHVGEKAPDFALESASGKVITLSSFAGHNVLLDFYEGYW